MIKCRRFIYLIIFLLNGCFIVGNPRVLFVVHKFPRITETFILGQVIGLIENGYDVSIWACQGDETDIVQSKILEYNLMERMRYINFYDANTHDFIRDHINKFDIVYCQYDRIGCVFAKFKSESQLKGKLVVCIRGGPLKNRVKRNPRGYETLFKTTDLFLPVCYYFKNDLMNYGVSEEKILVHHSAIDCNTISYKQRIYSEEPINVLTVARLIMSKGIDFGIRAMAELCRRYKNITYTIIGGGKLHAYLQKLIDKLHMNKNIKLIGWQPHEIITEYLYKSHILLHPSTRSEGIPNAIMEAMASGLPVVSTKVNGIPELVHDGVSGFVVSPEKITALTRKVECLIKNPKLCISMGYTGRKYVKKWHNVIIENNKLYDIFSELLHKVS